MATLYSILTEKHPVLAGSVAETQLAGVVQAAIDSWPGIALDPARFVAHLAERLPQGPEAAHAFAALHASDLYLAAGCAHHDPAAIAAFEGTFLSRVRAAVAKIDAAPDFVDEVRQRLRERLFVGARPRIADYNGQGPLGVWLRVAAIRVALNILREARRDAQLRPPAGVAGDAELSLIHHQYRAEVEASFRAAFARLDEDARVLLRMHYLEGVSLEEIGRQRGVDRSTASRRVAAVRHHLLYETKRELQRRVPALSGTSSDSLLLALRSKLDLSLESILGG